MSAYDYGTGAADPTSLYEYLHPVFIIIVLVVFINLVSVFLLNEGDKLEATECDKECVCLPEQFVRTKS